MKNAESTKKLLNAMSDFKTAYNLLVDAIDSYEQETNTSVNNLPAFAGSYPFDKSFDEVDINGWVTDVINGVKQSAFKVLNYEYLNTGGNTMVGIFEVWLPAELKTVYAFVNEEGCNLSHVDYIRNELDIDDYDELLMEYVDWGRVTGYERYFELYRHCLNEYTKSDCRYFKTTSQLPKYLLSDELQSQITAEYAQWMDANEYDLYETDGEKIIESEYYESTTEEDKLLNAVKAFKRWHDTIAGDEKYYEDSYTITIADKSITLPFMASAFAGVDELLNIFISEW